MCSCNIDLSQFFSQEEWQTIFTAAEVAHDRGWRTYIVGGTIRDCLLKGQSSPRNETNGDFIKDIDLVIDGAEMAGVEVAIALHAQYPEAKLTTHEKFQTAVLDWENFSVDIATARTEIYTHLGANPQVRASTIQQDLYRRDFTINALAVEIYPHPDKKFSLLDWFDGYTDLQQGIIRAIRVGSFAEDPRRIFRAVRFAVRFGFAIAPSNLTEIQELAHSGLHDAIGGSRLKAELYYILSSAKVTDLALPKMVTMLQWLDQLGALRCVHPHLHLPKDFSQQLRRLQRWLGWFSDRHDLPQVGLELILSYLKPDEAIPEGMRTAPTNLNLLPTQISRQQKLPILLTQLEHLDQQLNPSRPSAIVAILNRYDLVTLLLAAAKCTKRQRYFLWQYLTKWQQIKPLLTGNDLKRLGCPQGKAIGLLLAKIHDATLDGAIATTAEAIDFAKQIL